MTTGNVYHNGNRRLQDQFGSHRISVRLEEKLGRTIYGRRQGFHRERAVFFPFNGGCQRTSGLLL
jgi:hypothetical protein